MSVFLSTLAPRPADALLGLMMAFQADPRPEKVDLGVGVYRDASGTTPIMAAVRAAEARRLETETTKAYEGPRGNGAFCDAIEALVLGEQASARREGRVVSLATPGGCGALFLAVMFAGRVAGLGRVWVSDPSWPNHAHLVRTAGRELMAYPYVDAATGDVAFAAMMDALREAKPGDIVLIQGPCHNPTGIDLSDEQWAYLGDFCARQRLMPLIDVAYHGFGAGLDADMAGIRAFLAEAPEAIVAYSCSKNFGLYRERTGCLLLQGASQRDAGAAFTHLADIARAAWSMPPAHGAALVATILADAALKADWQAELDAMAERMQRLRAAFAEALGRATGGAGFDRLTAQKGMFSQLPLSPEAAEALRVREAIYVPASGRINIAGLPEGDLAPLAARIAPYLGP